MRSLRAWYPAAIVVATFALSIIAWPRLPDAMPVHWNAHGQVDRYGSRLEGAFLLPAITLLLWGALRGLPRIDPRRANYARFAGSYDLVVAAILTFLLLLHSATLGIALGWPIALPRVLALAGGLMLVVIGNVLPRARSNWFFGVRTPWTLSDDRVWTRTHRVAGYLVTADGAAWILAAAVARPWATGLAIALAIVAAVGSVLYSYLTWKQETSR